MRVRGYVNEVLMKSKYVISYFLAFSMMFLWFRVSENLQLENIKRYIISVIIYMLVIAASMLLFSMVRRNSTLQVSSVQSTGRDRWFLVSIVILCFLLEIFVVDLIYYNSIEMLGVIGIPLSSTQWTLLALLTVVLFMMNEIKEILFRQNYYFLNQNTWGGISKSLFFLFVIGILVFVTYRNFLPNFWGDGHNWEAYWSSGFARFHSIPIDMRTISYYGSYSILAIPFFRLVGFNVVTVSLHSIILNLIITGIFIYLTFVFTKKNYILRSALLLAFAYFYLRPDAVLYPQGIPSRIFVSSLIMLMGAVVHKRTVGKSKYRVLLYFGYFVASFGLIYSNDFGLFALFSWVAYHLHLNLTDRNAEMKMHIKLISPLLMGTVAFLAAWQFVSLYNINFLSGPPISLNQFIYPMNTPFPQGMSAPLPISIGIWLVFLSVILLGFTLGLPFKIFSAARQKNKNFDSRLSFLFMVSVLALMNFIYYANRPAIGNLFLSVYIQVLILLILIYPYVRDCFVQIHNRNWLNFLMKKIITITIIYMISIVLMDSANNLKMMTSTINRFQDNSNISQIKAELRRKLPLEARILGSEKTLVASILEIERNNIIFSNTVNGTAESYADIRNILLTEKGTYVIAGEDSLAAINERSISEVEMNNIFGEIEEVVIHGISLYILRSK